METIGTYKIESTLRPGSRPLYLAADKSGKKVVIKVAPLAGLSPEEKERFLREAAICKDLDHPNLLKVIDSGETKEVLYQVMDHLEGMDFAKVFGSGRQFSWAEKLALMDAVCDGLQYAHSKNLVHRDIKPANLFLENNGHVRILDFGMVRTESSALTRVGTALGTLNYMAPEQIRGETCTAASDVFAAGIVFQQLCTGQHPFAARRKTLPEILSAILFEEPPAWAGVAPDGSPEGLEFVLRRALEKDPSKRWQSAGELRQALSLCRFTLENRPAEVVKAPDPLPEPGPEAPDPNKTMVVKRAPRPVVQPAPRPEPPPPPQPSTPPPQPARPATQVCPHCTRPNVPGTGVCAHCGRAIEPAEPGVSPQPEGIRTQWILLGVGALLAIIALILIVGKSG